MSTTPTPLTYPVGSKVTLHPDLIPNLAYGGLFLVDSVYDLFKQQGYLTIESAIQKTYLSYYGIEGCEYEIGAYLTDAMISGLYQPTPTFSLLDILNHHCPSTTTFTTHNNDFSVTKYSDGSITFSESITDIPDPTWPMYTLVPPKKVLTHTEAFQALLEGKEIHYEKDGITYTFDLDTARLNGTQLGDITFYTL